MTEAPLAEHFFRHEYGRLVATLTRRIGVQHLADIEDAVQTALMAALESWTISGRPERPAAWLFRVAHNHVLGELANRARHRRLLEENAAAKRAVAEQGSDASVAEAAEDLLRLLFVCCDESIPVDSQLVLALKTLCGFGIREIAQRLFTSEANVYKRLGRARKRLRELPPPTSRELVDEQYSARLPAVTKVLYLLFTEGYLSLDGEVAIRRELCDEAIRLATILVEHPVGRTPEALALLALMHLHAARMTARQDGSGGLLLLEEQDRGLWDGQMIAVGLRWLAESARGEVFSRYHAEAGIAAEHCLARSFGETRWAKVVECYELLEQVAPSAIHRLNRAVAVAEWRGPAAGLAVLDGFEPPKWLAGSYLWAAVLADLHRRAGHTSAAVHHRQVALESAPTDAVRRLLRRRLG
ncbi:MAG: sigma-70 family RNA polymerase sigma factor [bacterium]|nr:sigma-70 family RNA polymerase sigma factor [bacterium]